MFKQLGRCIIPLVSIEYKSVSGEGGCGPLTRHRIPFESFFYLDQVYCFRVFLHPF